MNMFENSKKLLLNIISKSFFIKKTGFLSKIFFKSVYYGFPLIEETNFDGWIYGAITEFIEKNGCDNGDAYVQAPNKKRAGIVWDVGDKPM